MERLKGLFTSSTSSQNDATNTKTNFKYTANQGSLELSDHSLDIRKIINNTPLALERWFNKQDIALVSQLIQQLQKNAPSKKSSLECIQAFLQLHKLAKPEYRELFIERWDGTTHKFIFAGYVELISPLKLKQQNNNIEGLSHKIYDILSKDIPHEKKDKLLTTLIMLIEKHLIEGKTHKVNTYYFQNPTLTWQPKSGSTIQDIESYDTSYDALNDGNIIEAGLNNPEVGLLTQNKNICIFTRAKNFTENSIEINCFISNTVLYKKITIDLNEITSDIYTNLFDNGVLLYALLDKNYKSAFKYLLNSEYFTPNFNYDTSRLPTNIKSLLATNNINTCGTILNLAITNKKYECLEMLLAQGAEVTKDIVNDLINQTKKIQLIVTQEEHLKFKLVLSLLKYAKKNIFDYYNENIETFCIGTDDSTNTSLLDYALNFLPKDQRLQAVSDILTIITKHCRNNNIIIFRLFNILQSNNLTYYIEHYNFIADEFIKACLSKIIYHETFKNFLLENKNLNIFLKILQKKLNVAIKNPKQDSSYFRIQNPQIILLIFAGINSTDLTISTNAKKLYESYLSLEWVQNLFQNPEFTTLFGDFEKKPLWQEEPNKDAANYIIINKGLIMLLSHNSLEKFLDKTNKYSFINWKEFFLFDTQGNNLAISQYSLIELFKLSIFQENFYNYISNRQMFSKFINNLSLNEYNEPLTKALTNSIPRNNLFIQTSDDDKLYDLLKKYIAFDQDEVISGITTEHLTYIKKTFKLEKQNTIIQGIICIAYVFVKYSSNGFFGDEYRSPFSMRLYAYALLKEADKLDKNSLYKNWQDRLTGKAFSCTSVLAMIMLEKIQKLCDKEFIAQIIPIKFQ